MAALVQRHLQNSALTFISFDRTEFLEPVPQLLLTLLHNLQVIHSSLLYWVNPTETSRSGVLRLLRKCLYKVWLFPQD